MEALKTGTTYLLRHVREGQAEVEVIGESPDGEWVDVKLLSSGFRHMSHNQPQIGDGMRVRRSFCEFVEKVL